MERPLVALVGATGAGKTTLALDCVEAAGVAAEIINLDSRQLYRPLAVGTAKPTAAEQTRVRHHLIDLLELDEEYDAARYRCAVEELLPQLWGRGIVPLVVGGAGFYLRALREGFFDFEYSASELADVRERIQQLEEAELWERLAREDPRSAERLHRNDRYRITRALEILELSGRPLGELEAEFEPRPVHGCVFDSFHLMPERRVLHERIERRATLWLEGTWQREVESLLEEGASEDSPGLRVLGYPQVIQLLRGELSPEAAREQIVVATRRYAKQQETWFRKESCQARGEDLAGALVASLRRAAGCLDSP